MTGMRLAGIDDALELRVREDAGGEEARRQMWAVAGAGRGDRGHGRPERRSSWVERSTNRAISPSTSARSWL